MGKYFRKDPNITELTNDEKETLVSIRTSIRQAIQNKERNFVERFICYFLTGKDTREFNNFKFNGLPKRTGKVNEDYQNIKDYFTEYSKEYIKEKSYDISNSITSGLDTLAIEHIVDGVNKNLNGSQASDLIEKTIKDKNISKYDEYKVYCEAVSRRAQRPKTHFWNIIQNFRNSKEDKAILKLKNHLMSIGVKEQVLNNVSDFKPLYETDFKKNLQMSISDRVKNYESQIKLQQERFQRRYGMLKSSELDERHYNSYIEACVPFVKTLEQFHEQDRNKVMNEFDQENFRQEELYIQYFKKQVNQFFHKNLNDLVDEAVDSYNPRTDSKKLYIINGKELDGPVDPVQKYFNEQKALGNPSLKNDIDDPSLDDSYIPDF